MKTRSWGWLAIALSVVLAVQMFEKENIDYLLLKYNLSNVKAVSRGFFFDGSKAEFYYLTPDNMVVVLEVGAKNTAYAIPIESALIGAGYDANYQTVGDRINRGDISCRITVSDTAPAVDVSCITHRGPRDIQVNGSLLIMDDESYQEIPRLTTKIRDGLRTICH